MFPLGRLAFAFEFEFVFVFVLDTVAIGVAIGVGLETFVLRLALLLFEALFEVASPHPIATAPSARTAVSAIFFIILL